MTGDPDPPKPGGAGGDAPPEGAASEAPAGVPRDAGGPVFGAPWEAQAFALAIALSERGAFTWKEWTEALAHEIRAAGARDDGSGYYRHWLAALERLATAKGLVGEAELLRRREAWDAAARATPHGRPIELPPGERR